MNRRKLGALAAGVLFSLTSATAFAETWPNKPIRAIVPFSAGGGTDTVARLVLQKVSESLGQPIVVENKVGVGGVVGDGEVAHAKPDGYTIGVTGSGFQLFNLLFDKLNFNAATDLVVVAPLASVPIAVVVGRSVPAKTMSELIAFAKSSQTPLAYATPGISTRHHLAGVVLGQLTGMQLEHVPYKGTTPVFNDIVGGHIPIGIVGLPGALPYAKSGQLKVIGVGGAKRSELAPDIPTIAEGGVKNFEASYWWDISVPKGTPQPIIDRLHKEITKALQNPGLRETLLKGGYEPMVMTREEMTAMVKADTVKWGKVIHDHNIRGQ